MKSYLEVKDAYVKDHLSKPLKAPNIRLGALNNIEKAIRKENNKLLEGGTLFKKFTKESFSNYYLSLKDRPLNSAEKSVIHGLFKFSN